MGGWRLRNITNPPGRAPRGLTRPGHSVYNSLILFFQRGFLTPMILIARSSA